MAMEAPEKGCMVLAEILKQDAERERKLPCFAQEGAVDGIIVMGETGGSISVSCSAA